MSVLVRRSQSVLVRPSEPVSMCSSTIKLSSFDKGLEKMQVAALLMFEHPIHEVSNTIKRALSQALVHYYPISGRIVAGGDDGDEVHIQCNGEGVVFVDASANCALKEALLDGSGSHGASRRLLAQLAVFTPAKGLGPTDPLLLMQVTQFSCGGFVLGATWNHAVADGAGMAQFLQAVGELTCGFSSPSTVPVRWDGSLLSPPQQPATSLDPFDDLSSLEITLPSRLIKRVQAEFSCRFTGQRCTQFEVASAVLWQCRARAITCNPETPSLFCFAADVRKLVGAKKGYYGNCIAGQLVMATSGMVASGDVVDLVKMIKDSKEKIGDQFKKNESSIPLQEEAGQMLQQLARLRYSVFVVSSWRNLGFDEVDFGSGRPARVLPLGEDKPPFPVCVLCPPWKERDGVNVLSAMLKQEHVDAFHGELARFT